MTKAQAQARLTLAPSPGPGLGWQVNAPILAAHSGLGNEFGMGFGMRFSFVANGLEASFQNSGIPAPL